MGSFWNLCEVMLPEEMTPAKVTRPVAERGDIERFYILMVCKIIDFCIGYLINPSLSPFQIGYLVGSLGQGNLDLRKRSLRSLQHVVFTKWHTSLLRTQDLKLVLL